MISPARHEQEEARPDLFLREWEDGDRAFVLESWRMSWRQSRRFRRLSGPIYRGVFDELVRRGVVALSDTRVLIACARQATEVIAGWLCYTPGRLPVIHYAIVRGEQIRRQGIFTAMIRRAGVSDRMVYTFRPPPKRHRPGRNNPRFDLEAAMLAAAARHDVTAQYRPVEDFLRDP